MTKGQKEIFINSEGDKFYERNVKEYWIKGKIKNDQILQGIEFLNLQPKTVLEIGCSIGWRLHALSQKYRAKCFGIEPSLKAIKEGRRKYAKSAISLQRGTADILPFKDNMFDTVILGFCLYLCDRKDLFKIAYEVDRVLSDLGHIIIEDYHPTSFPYRNKYIYHPGMFSYKMDYSNMFSWNPAYKIIFKKIFFHLDFEQTNDPDERRSIIILKKDMQFSYPENPYSK